MSIPKRVEQIRQKVSIVQVLHHYGYTVRLDLEGREQQFACDLHGTGRDNKPSARVYSATNSWYCFGCIKARDAIATVQEKENLSFMAAIRRLEKWFNLPFIESEPGDFTRIPENNYLEPLDRDKPFDQYVNRVERLIKGLMESPAQINLNESLVLFEALDKVQALVEKKELDENKAKHQVLVIHSKTLSLVSKCSNSA